MMKPTRLVFLILPFFAFKSFGQLSLSETINYIDNKLKETSDLKRTYSSQYTYILSGLKFSAYAGNKNKVVLSYNRAFSDNTNDEFQYIFDPTHLSDVTIKSVADEDAVGLLLLNFNKETVIQRQKSNKLNETTKNVLPFPYLKTDKLNAERLTKAFLLLKDLYKAKKGADPFASIAPSSLSIDQTLNYIHERMQECDQLKFTYYNPSKLKFSNLEFGYLAEDKNKVVANLTLNYDSGSKEEIQYIFNPTHIKGFAFYIGLKEDPVSYIGVQTEGNTVIVKKRSNGSFKETTDWYLKIPFINVDPLNQERMRKAFLHLKKLFTTKKAPDPFAN